MIHKTLSLILVLSLALGAVFSSSFTQAHRLKTVLTTVELNSRTGMLEVIHRAYAHDVEHTLGPSLRSAGGLESIEGQARVALQLSNSFSLWLEDGSKLELDVVGAELEAEYLYIYQETPMDSMPNTLRVRHEMLRNYWPDMINYLNVHFGEQVRTLIFADSDGSQNISATQE